MNFLIFQGFICPICRSIFENHTDLTDHYSKNHSQPIVNSNYLGDAQPQVDEHSDQIDSIC